jgi:3-hydroxyacyl-[acyl-carrier-protein] dehydratase
VKPPRDARALRLGPDVIAQLIPHRRPFVMVDAVVAYRHGATPTLWASRSISANEDVFAGHFPGCHVWPGVYTIEGLGQSTLICAIVATLIRERERTGGTAAEVYDALLALQRQAVQPFARATGAPAGLEVGRGGMAGHVDVKFLAPVFAGCRLDYVVTLTHVVEPLARFDVEAFVDGEPVARGTMTGVIGPPPAAATAAA